jgi:hypothetical protein
MHGCHPTRELSNGVIDLHEQRLNLSHFGFERVSAKVNPDGLDEGPSMIANRAFEASKEGYACVGTAFCDTPAVGAQGVEGVPQRFAHRARATDELDGP